MAVLSSRGRGPGPVSGPGLPLPGIAAVLLLALLFAATQYAGVLTVPFVGDDYFSLDKTRDASFAVVWAPQALVSHFYRPWSREGHYWVLQRLFGLRVEPYHAVSVGLWAGIMALYFALVRRLTGGRVAALATAAAMTLAGWGVLLVWTQGAEDLWMMLFALACFHAVLRGRMAWAGVAQLLALLSKETAALLPLMVFVLEWRVLRRTPGEAARRAAPLALVAVVWAALHPLLGGRLWWPRFDAVLPGLHPPLARIAASTLLAVVNLHALPAPETGWAGGLRTALPGVAGVLALAAWGLFAGGGREDAHRGVGTRRVAIFGVAWALLGWAPLLMPTVAWHPYPVLFGALGAWFALAVALARAPWPALALVSALAVTRAGLAATPSADWGTEWFQLRAARFSEAAHGEWRRLRPVLPPHSRVFLSGLPGGTGLLPGGEESPPLRVWYRDRTLRAATWERYAPRAAGDSLGEDVFLRFDFDGGWREVMRSAEHWRTDEGRAPPWRADHERLAIALSRGGDWAAAADEYMKLASGFPAEASYPYYAGLALAAQGDSVRAVDWIRAAAARPSADEEIRAAARTLAQRTGSAGPR
jgi:hypothetical protein